MEVCCSFKTIIGGICGSDSRDKKEVTVIPLVCCSRDIAKHLGSLAFSGPENEVDLILSRAAIFKIPHDVNDMNSVRLPGLRVCAFILYYKYRQLSPPSF
jgi:hypothetical protein